jgi:hypothetical protein
VLAAALVGACTSAPEPFLRPGPAGRPPLPDGRVLLTGGYDSSIVPADAAYVVRP